MVNDYYLSHSQIRSVLYAAILAILQHFINKSHSFVIQ